MVRKRFKKDEDDGVVDDKEKVKKDIKSKGLVCSQTIPYIVWNTTTA